MSKDEFNDGDYVPMELQGLKNIIKAFPGRIAALFWKAVSIEGLVLLLTFFLTMYAKVDSYAWIVVSAFLIFGRKSIDFIKELKK